MENLNLLRASYRQQLVCKREGNVGYRGTNVRNPAAREPTGCDRLNAEAILNDAMNRLGLKVVFSSIIPRTLNSIGQRWVNGDVALTQIYASVE